MAGSNFDRGANTARLLLRKHLPNEANPVTCPALAMPSRGSRCFLSLPLFSLLLIATFGFASTEPPKAKTLPCGLADAEAAGLDGDTSTDIHAVSNYSNTMYGLLQAGKFEQLDCLADSVRSHKETFSGGLWKIHAVYSGLASPRLHPTQEDWTRHIESLQRWLAAQPSRLGWVGWNATWDTAGMRAAKDLATRSARVDGSFSRNERRRHGNSSNNRRSRTGIQNGLLPCKT